MKDPNHKQIYVELPEKQMLQTYDCRQVSEEITVVHPISFMLRSPIYKKAVTAFRLKASIQHQLSVSDLSWNHNMLWFMRIRDKAEKKYLVICWGIIKKQGGGALNSRVASADPVFGYWC